MTDFMAFLIFLSIIYYLICALIYRRTKSLRTRKLFHLLVFPLPVAFLLGVHLYSFTQDGDLHDYEELVNLLVALSVCLGGGVLAHAFLDRKKTDALLAARLAAGAVLLGAPVLAIDPDLEFLTVGLYLLAGSCLGVYGFSSYHQGKGTGLVYIYLSLLFMAVVPLLALAIVSIYRDQHSPDELIVLRGHFDPYPVSCHAPYFPPPPGAASEDTWMPAAFISFYLAFMGLLATLRRQKLRKVVTKEGLIPEEFNQILEKEEKDGER